MNMGGKQISANKQGILIAIIMLLVSSILVGCGNSEQTIQSQYAPDVPSSEKTIQPPNAPDVPGVIAFIRENGIWLMEEDGSGQRILAENQNGQRFLGPAYFSQSGRSLVANIYPIDQGEFIDIAIIDVQTGDRVTLGDKYPSIWEGTGYELAGADGWNGDDVIYCTLVEDKPDHSGVNLASVNIVTGKITTVIENFNFDYKAISNDGRNLIYYLGEDVFRVNLQTGEEEKFVSEISSPIHGLALSTDGNHVAYVTHWIPEIYLCLHELGTDNTENLYIGSMTTCINFPYFSPDGMEVVFSSYSVTYSDYSDPGSYFPETIMKVSVELDYDSVYRHKVASLTEGSCPTWGMKIK